MRYHDHSTWFLVGDHWMKTTDIKGGTVLGLIRALSRVRAYCIARWDVPESTIVRSRLPVWLQIAYTNDDRSQLHADLLKVGIEVVDSGEPHLTWWKRGSEKWERFWVERWWKEVGSGWKASTDPVRPWDGEAQ